MINNEIQIVGGLVGDGLDAISKSISNGIVNGLLLVLSYVLIIVYWFCKNGIMVCFLTYICSKDKTIITAGVKLSFLYLISSIIGGMI